MDKNEMLNAFLSPAEVQKIFNISRPTEIRYRKNGILPQPIKLGRLVFYRSSDIENIKVA